MGGTDNGKITPIECTDLRDVQPFRQGYNTTICEIDPNILILLHDVFSAFDIGHRQRRQFKSR